MYPYYNSYGNFMALHQDDIEGIQSLYGAPDTTVPTSTESDITEDVRWTTFSFLTRTELPFITSTPRPEFPNTPTTSNEYRTVTSEFTTPTVKYNTARSDLKNTNDITQSYFTGTRSFLTGTQSFHTGTQSFRTGNPTLHHYTTKSTNPAGPNTAKTSISTQSFITGTPMPYW